MSEIAKPVMIAGAMMVLAFVGGLALSRAPGAFTRQPAAASFACQLPARPYARLELLFGTTRPGGTQVTEAEWLAFLDTEVTPRFPDGLTVLTGVGQWRNVSGQIARETARVLLVWHVPGPRTEAGIAAIRAAYRERFAQESVMRVDGTGCVAF